MTLEAFYYLAQIIAALAVVGSLVFVGVQIKGQTREQRLMRIQDHNDIVTTLFQMLADDHGNRAVLIKGLQSFHALPPEDRLLFDSLMAIIARAALIFERQYLDGDISDKSFGEFVAYMSVYWGAPGFEEWLAARGPEVFGSAFGFVGPVVGSAKGLSVYETWRARFVGVADDD